MRRTEVRLVTHASTELAYADVANRLPLGVEATAAGEEDALQLGRMWARSGLRIDWFHSSPLRACTRTAELLQQGLRPGQRPSFTMPPALNTGAMYRITAERGWGAAEASPQVIYDAAPSPSASKEVAIVAPDCRVLTGAGMVAGYLASLRNVQRPPESVVAVSDSGTINAMLALLEVGIPNALQDPREHLRRVIERAPLEPCSETLVVLEGYGQDLQGTIPYVGAPVWEMQS